MSLCSLDCFIMVIKYKLGMGSFMASSNFKRKIRVNIFYLYFKLNLFKFEINPGGTEEIVYIKYKNSIEPVM